MKEYTKNYVAGLLVAKRMGLLNEQKTIDKGSVEGFKRNGEIEIELKLLREAIIEMG